MGTTVSQTPVQCLEDVQPALKQCKGTPSILSFPEKRCLPLVDLGLPYGKGKDVLRSASGRMRFLKESTAAASKIEDQQLPEKFMYRIKDEYPSASFFLSVSCNQHSALESVPCDQLLVRTLGSSTYILVPPDQFQKFSQFHSSDILEGYLGSLEIIGNMLQKTRTQFYKCKLLPFQALWLPKGWGVYAYHHSEPKITSTITCLTGSRFELNEEPEYVFDHWDDIGDDCQVVVMSHLDLFTLTAIGKTCSKHYAEVSSNSVLWKTIFARDNDLPTSIFQESSQLTMATIGKIHNIFHASCNIEEAIRSLDIIRPDDLVLFLLKTCGAETTLWDEGLRDSTVRITSYIQIILSHLQLRGVELMQALRGFLYMFPLPCRSKFVDIVLEEFGKAYCDQNENEFIDATGTTSLLYALLMLNTDLTSTTIRGDLKLKPDQFVKGMAGINNGQDLPMDKLLEWYTDIKNNPISAMVDKSLGLPPPFYSGSIYTKYSVSSKIKRQWCVIRRGYLELYSEPLSSTPLLGPFDLTTCTIEAVDSVNQLVQLFKITTKDPLTLLFATTSVEEYCIGELYLDSGSVEIAWVSIV